MKKAKESALLILFSMSLIGLSLPASAGGSSAVSSVVTEQNCSSWSPDSNSVSIGTKFKQERTCTGGYESRYISGKKQAWANQTAINNDWAATGEKYNCKTIAGNEVCDVKQEKSTMIVQKDSVSGMLRIESISKTSRVSQTTDVIGFIAPTYTVQEAEDKVIGTYDSCTESTTEWMPSLENASYYFYFDQTRTRTETCITNQMWSSGKTVAISSRNSSQIESQNVRGEDECAIPSSGGFNAAAAIAACKAARDAANP